MKNNISEAQPVWKIILTTSSKPRIRVCRIQNSLSLSNIFFYSLNVHVSLLRRAISHFQHLRYLCHTT
jgi:hypothetical protein